MKKYYTYVDKSHRFDTFNRFTYYGNPVALSECVASQRLRCSTWSKLSRSKVSRMPIAQAKTRPSKLTTLFMNSFDCPFGGQIPSFSGTPCPTKSIAQLAGP